MDCPWGARRPRLGTLGVRWKADLRTGISATEPAERTQEGAGEPVLNRPAGAGPRTDQLALGCPSRMPPPVSNGRVAAGTET